MDGLPPKIRLSALPPLLPPPFRAPLMQVRPPVPVPGSVQLELIILERRDSLTD